MAGRSPARFLAPLALVAFGVALFLVVSSTQKSDDAGAPNRTTNGQPAASPASGENGSGEDAEPERRGPRRYTVEPGDTPSSIADETGVPLEDILRLNPDLDPQTLSPGQRIRLRQ